MKQQENRQNTQDNQAQTSVVPEQFAQEKPASLGKKVLSDLSGPQIIASVLAAVTAMLLSSQIGLAGSVIGVAVSAAITALSSSVYKSFLEGTRQKAKQQFTQENEEASDLPLTQATQALPISAVQQTSHDQPTRVLQTLDQADSTQPLQTQTPPAQATQALPITPEQQEATKVLYSHSHSAFSTENAKYTHEQVKRRQSRAQRIANLIRSKWFALVVLTVIGLLSVFITTQVINNATDGAGLGTKTQPIIVPRTPNTTESSATTAPTVPEQTSSASEKPTSEQSSASQTSSSSTQSQSSASQSSSSEISEQSSSTSSSSASSQSTSEKSSQTATP